MKVRAKNTEVYSLSPHESILSRRIIYSPTPVPLFFSPLITAPLEVSFI